MRDCLVNGTTRIGVSKTPSDCLRISSAVAEKHRDKGNQALAANKSFVTYENAVAQWNWLLGEINRSCSCTPMFTGYVERHDGIGRHSKKPLLNCSDLMKI